MERHGKLDPSRRSFLTGVAGAGALAALGEVWAQATPSPAAPPGTVPSETVKAEKVKAMQFYSERPLTGGVPAHEHGFDVT